MSTVDSSIIPSRKRVLHVPLTDAEFRALKIRALDTAETMGEVVAAALRATLTNGDTTDD